MKLSLALLALAAAASEQAPAEQAAPAEPEVEQGDYTEYEQAPESMEVHYAHVAAPLCLGTCLQHHRCQNIKTGECFRPEYDGQEYHKEELEKLQCPEGSIDLNHTRLTNNTALWVAFALLFLPGLYVWYVTFYDSHYDAVALAKGANFDCVFYDGKKSYSADAKVAFFVSEVKTHRSFSLAILFIASLAYLTMALGHGVVTKCDGRNFYYARYVDWFLTTPLILLEILSRANIDTHEKFFIVFADLIMIVAGLIGSLIIGNNKWVFFAFSMLAFLPILVFLYDANDRLISNNATFRSRFNQVVLITFFTWIFYPVVWILAEGTGHISATGETIFYTVLDVIAKSVLAIILVSPGSNFSVSGGAVGAKGAGASSGAGGAGAGSML